MVGSAAAQFFSLSASGCAHVEQARERAKIWQPAACRVEGSSGEGCTEGHAYNNRFVWCARRQIRTTNLNIEPLSVPLSSRECFSVKTAAPCVSNLSVLLSLLTAASVFLTSTNTYDGGGDSDDDTYSDTLDTAKLEAEIRSLRQALGELEDDPAGPVREEPETGKVMEMAAAPLAARQAEQAEVRQTLVEYLNELKRGTDTGDNLVEFPSDYSKLVDSTYAVRAFVPHARCRHVLPLFQRPS